nr:MAG TPA: hypothetical protein [Caudoviricetes sp.]
MVQLEYFSHPLYSAGRSAQYLSCCFLLYKRCCPSAALYPARPLASILPVSPRFNSLYIVE